MRLADGSVVPSFLSLADTRTSQSTGIWDNMVLRLGEVTDIIFPDDPRSLSHKLIEYKVRVQHRDSNGYAAIDYGNCFVANLFGGISDKFRYTLRKDTRAQDKTHNIGMGSKVLILCINAETQNAVIVGGIRDSQEQVKDVKEDGHNLFFEFNGLRASISDAGELTVLRRGKTQPDGTLDGSVDTSLVNQILSMTADGRTTIGYSRDQGDNPFISWDEQSDSIVVHASDLVQVEIGSGPLNVQTSDGVKINAATEAFLRGTTFRKNQHQLHNSLKQGLGTAAQAASSMAATFAAVMPSPASLKAALVAAAGNLNSVISALNSIKAAIDSFESSASQYLSKKHFHDD